MNSWSRERRANRWADEEKELEDINVMMMNDVREAEEAAQVLEDASSLEDPSDSEADIYISDRAKLAPISPVEIWN